MPLPAVFDLNTIPPFLPDYALLLTASCYCCCFKQFFLIVLKRLLYRLHSKSLRYKGRFLSS